MTLLSSHRSKHVCKDGRYCEQGLFTKQSMECISLEVLKSNMFNHLVTLGIRGFFLSAMRRFVGLWLTYIRPKVENTSGEAM